MCRFVFLLAAVALLATACADDRVRLERGPLGPARYRVELGVSGGAALRSEEVEASLEVTTVAEGASLHLAVSGEDPIVAEVKRDASGRLVLDTVQRVPPSSAGEADLASLVSQLDPPLPATPVRLGQRWSSTRSIGTESLQAELTARLRIVRFRRVGGADAADIRGSVSGRLRALGATGFFEGSVDGTTSIAWSLDHGRLASSRTELVWTIPDVGRVVVRTSVEPE